MGMRFKLRLSDWKFWVLKGPGALVPKVLPGVLDIFLYSWAPWNHSFQRQHQIDMGMRFKRRLSDLKSWVL